MADSPTRRVNRAENADLFGQRRHGPVSLGLAVDRCERSSHLLVAQRGEPTLGSLRYLFATVLEGRNAHVGDGVGGVGSSLGDFHLGWRDRLAYGHVSSHRARQRALERRASRSIRYRPGCP